MPSNLRNWLDMFAYGQYRDTPLDSPTWLVGTHMSNNDPKCPINAMGMTTHTYIYISGSFNFLFANLR
jgi:hypothetical protein